LPYSLSVSLQVVVLLTAFGPWPLWSPQYWMTESASCLSLFVQEMARARSRAWFSAGSSMPARTAMIAMTTSSSINVKRRRLPAEAAFRRK